MPFSLTSRTSLLCHYVGAGKTTLLNALGGRATYGEVSGHVTLGGRPLTSEDLNYVPQFDDQNGNFSPRELLTYMKHLQVSWSARTDGSERQAIGEQYVELWFSIYRPT